MMKKTYLLFLLLFSMSACVDCPISLKNMVYTQDNIDMYFEGVNANLVYYHVAFDLYGSNKKGVPFEEYSPCSTFKIPTTLMGLDQGVLVDSQTQMGYDGAIHSYETWNKDVTLQEAFQASCVWYYKKVMDKLAKKDVKNYLTINNYGNCDLGAWNQDSHQVFWIESSLKISPFAQVNFLKSIFTGQSNFKPEHIAILKNCMSCGKAGDFSLYGKTGTGRNYQTNHLEGWFVGFAALNDKTIVYFAVHAANPDKDVMGPDVREMMRKMLSEYQFINKKIL